jgi:hypothetical protein
MIRNYDARPVFETVSEQTYTLSKSIAATEFACGKDGELYFGPLLSLPEGAEIECCGQGFNERTVKVRWHEKFYFVFFEELAMQRENVKSFACGSA